MNGSGEDGNNDSDDDDEEEEAGAVALTVLLAVIAVGEMEVSAIVMLLTILNCSSITASPAFSATKIILSLSVTEANVSKLCAEVTFVVTLSLTDSNKAAISSYSADDFALISKTTASGSSSNCSKEAFGTCIAILTLSSAISSSLLAPLLEERGPTSEEMGTDETRVFFLCFFFLVAGVAEDENEYDELPPSRNWSEDDDCSESSETILFPITSAP